MLLSDITIDQIKTYHGYSGSDKNSQLTAILAMVLDEVREYCGHDFQSIARTNEKPVILPDAQYFYLKYFPVASITSLVEDGAAMVEDTDYFCNKDIGQVEKIQDFQDIRLTQDTPYWTTERNAIVVNYTGGHALTQDVVLVVHEMVGIRALIKTRTYVDDEGISRVATLTSIPKNLYDILDRHSLKGVIA